MEGLERYHNNRFAKAILYFVLFLVFVMAVVVYKIEFSAPALRAPLERFVVSQNGKSSDISGNLKKDGFIRSTIVFDYFFGRKNKEVAPGTYSLSKSMNVWQVVSALFGTPSEMWVTIPPGLRKEEIGDLLAGKLGWTDVQKNEWATATVGESPDYLEGVYSPDTYLIPIKDSPTTIAKRLRSHFEEKFAPLSKEAISKNIKWPTVLKIASLVQREAGSKEDMPIISGIIWNRLDKKMKLQIDATIQYARGNKGSGWWAPATHSDLSIDSPYNTYARTGLPPHPIANPSIDAIKATINPVDTTCLYYIHDSSRQIHCATTNAEQAENVAKYLK
jgi:UPF0755 protein